MIFAEAMPLASGASAGPRRSGSTPSTAITRIARGFQRGEERLGLDPVGLKPRQIKDNRAVGEEGEGLARDLVEIGEPLGNRGPGLEHEGEKGAAGQPEFRTGLGEGERQGLVNRG